MTHEIKITLDRINSILYTTEKKVSENTERNKTEREGKRTDSMSCRTNPSSLMCNWSPQRRSNKYQFYTFSDWFYEDSIAINKDITKNKHITRKLQTNIPHEHRCKNSKILLEHRHSSFTYVYSCFPRVG